MLTLWKIACNRANKSRYLKLEMNLIRLIKKKKRYTKNPIKPSKSGKRKNMTFSPKTRKKIVANWINRIMNMNNMNALTEWHIIYNSFENIGSVYLILSIIHGLRWYVCWAHSDKIYTYCINDHALMYEVTIGDVKFVFLCWHDKLWLSYWRMFSHQNPYSILHTPHFAYTHVEFLALILQTDSMLKLIYFFDSFIFHLFTNVFFSFFFFM